MNPETDRLARSYARALCRHLRRLPGAASSVAAVTAGLGRKAVAIGLKTLALARIHEQALAALEAVDCGTGRIRRADLFFVQAVAPVIETLDVVHQSRVDLQQLAVRLKDRTRELSDARRRLKGGISRRQGVEAALGRSREHHALLLAESLALQEGLRRIAHQLLTAQEEERRTTSRRLQDEVAQTLLGINAHLLSLKEASRRNHRVLDDGLGAVQDLVTGSVHPIRRPTRHRKPAGPSAIPPRGPARPPAQPGTPP